LDGFEPAENKPELGRFRLSGFEPFSIQIRPAPLSLAHPTREFQEEKKSAAQSEVYTCSVPVLYSFRGEEMHSNMKFGEAVLPHAETIPHHQMVFERPARDSSFPIGVREAERLPPDDSDRKSVVWERGQRSVGGE